MRTAASFSVNLPLAMISSNNSPPLQILKDNTVRMTGRSRGFVLGDFCREPQKYVVYMFKYLLSDDVVALLILKEFVHFHDIGVILKK